MCGICGYIQNSSGPFLDDPINLMNDVLIHRGPDGGGTYVDVQNRVCLGHRRLKILDLSDRAAQPMHNSDQSVWLTYNGEIYNYKELRLQLVKRGHTFQSDSDTEVVLNAYLEYGKDFVTKLNGDFAFSIWDSRRKTLLLYRDRIGIRPLYYAERNGVFGFASEIKALFKHPGLPRPKMRQDKIFEFFAYLCVYGEPTLFDQIYELLPGHYLERKEGKSTLRKYHTFRFDPCVRRLPHAEQMRLFANLFDDALQIRLCSDVPLGLYLSGGVDSSYLAARMGHFAGGRVHSYSLGFDHGNFNEFKFSDYASRISGTQHTKFIISADDFLQVLDSSIWHNDEPSPHIVSIPQFYLAKEAKKHITVSMAGSGGDEILAGYTHYANAMNRYLENSKPNHVDSFQNNYEAAYHKQLNPELIAAEFKSCTQKYILDSLFRISVPDYRRSLAHAFLDNDYPDFVSKMLYMDFQSHVVSMMVKDDKMNMAFGVEGRFPFLDYRVVAFALSMSPELKINNSTGKWALKELSLNYYEHDFVYREKQAFPTPIESWMSQAAPSPHSYKCKNSITPDMFNKDLLDIFCSDPGKLCPSGNNGRRKWGLFCLKRWCSMVCGENEHGFIF